jgi:hypothetical protein
MSTSFVTAGHVGAFQAVTMQLYGEVTFASCRINGAPGVAIVLVEHCRRREDWRHSKFAAQRFAHEVAPALTSFADSSPAPFIAGIKSARERIVARSDEIGRAFFANAASPSRRRRRSSRPPCMRKDAHRRACLISRKGSPRLPAARRIRTRVWSLRAGRRDCRSAPEASRAAQPQSRLRVACALSLASFMIFRRSGLLDRRQARVRAWRSPGLRPGPRKHTARRRVTYSIG